MYVHLFCLPSPKGPWATQPGLFSLVALRCLHGCLAVPCPGPAALWKHEPRCLLPTRKEFAHSLASPSIVWVNKVQAESDKVIQGHGQKLQGIWMALFGHLSQAMSKSWLMVSRGASIPSYQPVRELAFSLHSWWVCNCQPQSGCEIVPYSEGKQLLSGLLRPSQREPQFRQQHLVPSHHSLLAQQRQDPHPPAWKTPPITQLVALSRNGSILTGFSHPVQCSSAKSHTAVKDPSKAKWWWLHSTASKASISLPIFTIISKFPSFEEQHISWPALIPICSSLVPFPPSSPGCTYHGQFPLVP